MRLQSEREDTNMYGRLRDGPKRLQGLFSTRPLLEVYPSLRHRCRRPKAPPIGDAQPQSGFLDLLQAGTQQLDVPIVLAVPRVVHASGRQLRETSR
jgi:hypothetical protein